MHFLCRKMGGGQYLGGMKSERKKHSNKQKRYRKYEGCSVAQARPFGGFQAAWASFMQVCNSTAAAGHGPRHGAPQPGSAAPAAATGVYQCMRGAAAGTAAAELRLACAWLLGALGGAAQQRARHAVL